MRHFFTKFWFALLFTGIATTAGAQDKIILSARNAPVDQELTLQTIRPSPEPNTAEHFYLEGARLLKALEEEQQISSDTQEELQVHLDQSRAWIISKREDAWDSPDPLTDDEVQVMQYIEAVNLRLRMLRNMKQPST